MPLILLPKLLRTLRTYRSKTALLGLEIFCVCHKSCCAISFFPPGNALLCVRTVNLQLCSKTTYKISNFRDAVTAVYKNKKPAAPPTRRFQGEISTDILQPQETSPTSSTLISLNVYCQSLVKEVQLLDKHYTKDCCFIYQFSCICQHKYLKIPKLSHKHLSHPGTFQANFIIFSDQ